MARLEQGQVEEGRRLLEEALRADPSSVSAMHGLARALDLAGERLEARALLERAHAQAPTEPEPACDLAMLYLEKEMDSRAEQVLAPVLKAQPEHPRANLHMAMALAKTDPARARGHAAQALRTTDPELRKQAEELHRVLVQP
ncbi:tetratricopeptide repeat protein [Hyalangium rubrum]|uniref:Tetratricopeptide repeat protein n=1 Tax=Hyalangium rubrum TaxID=3103134 RepID=A0ABU5HDD6_9BACT|nr:tetratricopeptide repeat protein [Hyalangium sp. s54d21]MDY7231467.1 tetratricopeptide repeat protein [Hyalangium sp. s54d21]